MTTDSNKLQEEAVKILQDNWVQVDEGSGFTKPAADVYPYQWNWDSGFSAIGWRHIDIQRAMTEIETLFSGQWKNGFLPHVIFHIPSDNYFPNETFWQVQDTSDQAPEGMETSGMTQPPIHSISVWKVFETLEKTDSELALDWLELMYPKLLSLHTYLYRQRDQGNTGLITIYHPWESGMDNSPRWDTPLKNISIKEKALYERRDTGFVDARFRPSNANYDTYVYLAEKMREAGYDDEKLRQVHPFQVEDVFFSSVLHLANGYLLRIADTLNENTEEITTWQQRFRENINTRCQDRSNGLFYDRDLLSGKLLKENTIAAMSPLIGGDMNEEEVENLFDTLDEKLFCGEGSCRATLLPSTSLFSNKFTPDRYWRGPVWINTNWLMLDGLENAGADEYASGLRNNLINLLENHGIWEYYNPETLEGIGAEHFSWSAALAVDILTS
ncbi:MAG: trehalase family glycosidase [Candidatus Paceibacterota bacterium]